jgi:hypothetical protein
MGRKTRPFIDKKNEGTRHFHLVSKPLAPIAGPNADSESSSNVLQEYSKKERHDPINEDTDEDYSGTEEDYSDYEEDFRGNREEMFGEAAKYGIFFTDQLEYDYMQHLRDIQSDKVASAGAIFLPALKNDAQKKSTKNDCDIVLKDDQAEKEHNSDGEFDLSEDDEAQKEQLEEEEALLQDIKEALAAQLGEQPDDPRVMEILEALEDDAYCCSPDNEEFDDFILELNDNEDDEECSDDNEVENEVSLDAKEMRLLDEQFERLLEKEYDSDEDEDYDFDDDNEYDEDLPSELNDENSELKQQYVNKVFDDFLKDCDKYDNRKIMQLQSEDKMNESRKKFETLDELRKNLSELTVGIVEKYGFISEEEDNGEQEKSSGKNAIASRFTKEYKPTIIDEELDRLEVNRTAAKARKPKIIPATTKSKTKSKKK